MLKNCPCEKVTTSCLHLVETLTVGEKITVPIAGLQQCDQIWRYFGLWATF